MSFKTCIYDNSSSNNVTINDNIRISFNCNNTNATFKYKNFKHLNVELLNNFSQEEYNSFLQESAMSFRLISKSTILTGDSQVYVVSNITYKKYFSQFLPDFPLIEIINSDKSIPNSCIFLDSEPFGIQLDEKYILPFSILFPLLYTLSINNGKFVWNELIFNMLEISDNTNNLFYAYVKQELRYNICTTDKSVKINNGIIIYNINNNKFNKNGRIYSDKLQIYIPINLYFLLFGTQLLIFEYSNYNIDNNIDDNIDNNIDDNNIDGDKYDNKFKNLKIIDIPIKTAKINLPLISQSNLKIPISSKLVYKYRSLEFSILSEELMESYNDSPLTENQFKNNTISNHSYITLTNHPDGLLYILKKISNKNIKSYETLVDYIEKISDKNKNTFYFERYDKSIKISV
jgi:hypothetical protein